MNDQRASISDTHSLAISLFGPFEARVNGLSLRPLRSRKGQWLFALLALRSGREVQREWLADTLRPDSLTEEAFTSLRQSLSDLRRDFNSEPEPATHAVYQHLRAAARASRPVWSHSRGRAARARRGSRWRLRPDG